jgi:hypothetical protein
MHLVLPDAPIQRRADNLLNKRRAILRVRCNRMLDAVPKRENRSSLFDSSSNTSSRIPAWRGAHKRAFRTKTKGL